MSKYRIVDLFSGAGGLTFGFYYNLVNNQFEKRDNVEFVFANEFAPQAVAAFKKNYGDDIPMIAGDICGITDKEIDALQEQWDLMEFYAKKKDSQKVLELNSAFHDIIYSSTRSRFMAQVLRSYKEYIEKTRKSA